MIQHCVLFANWVKMKMRRTRGGLSAHSATCGSTKTVYCQTISFHHKTRTSYALTATNALQGKGQSENSCSMPNWFYNNSAHSDNNCTLILAHAHTQFLSFKFRLFSVESCLKCCDIKRVEGGVKVNVIMTLILPQGLWTSP